MEIVYGLSSGTVGRDPVPAPEDTVESMGEDENSVLISSLGLSPSSASLQQTGMTAGNHPPQKHTDIQFLI